MGFKGPTLLLRSCFLSRSETDEGPRRNPTSALSSTNLPYSPPALRLPDSPMSYLDSSDTGGRCSFPSTFLVPPFQSVRPL